MSRSPAHFLRRHDLAWIALALLAAGCFTYRWETKGPFEMSGAIRHLVLDPVNPHRLYAGAENGGLWVLDDDRHPENGWRPLSDRLESLQMRGVAKSSVDSNYLVAANAAGFVYLSKDHGASWAKITTQNFSYIRQILIAEGLTQVPAGNYTRLAKETRIWVAGRLGLFRIHLINDALDAVDKLYPQTAAQEPDVLDAIRNTLNDDLYIGVRRKGVFKRDGIPANPADAWKESAKWADFGDNQSDMIKLAMTPTASRIVAKFGRNVILNDSAGASGSWTATSAVPFEDSGGSDIGYRGNYSNRIGEWTSAIAISPTDKNVIAVGQSPLFLSTNGGGDWTEVKAGHEDQQRLAFSPDGTSLFIANDGGVFRRALSAAADHQPTGLNVKLTTAQFYRVGLNGQVAVGDADHQGIWGTRNVEATNVEWERATPNNNGFGNDGLENDFVSADSKIANRFFVGFARQHLLRLMFPPTGAGTQDLLPMNPTGVPLQPYRTMEDGTTPTNVVFNQLNYPVGTVAIDPRPGSNTMLVAVHVQPNTTFGIAVTRNANVNPSGGPKVPCPTPPPAPPVGGCFQTPVVGTAAWSPVFGPAPTPIVSISFSAAEPGKAYALDQSGQAFVLANVDDAAGRFQPAGGFAAAPPDFARQIVADPRTAGRLLALSHRQLQVSTDGNATVWNRIGQGSLPAVQLNALCLHPTNAKIVYLATATGVLVSNDRGATWSSISAGLPVVPVMQVFTNATHLFAVTFGRGLWRAKLPG